MRLLQLKLGEANFWFLNENIKLDINNRSSFIDINSLTDEEINAINSSLRSLLVYGFDLENNRITALQNLVLENTEFSINLEDEEEEDENAPEIVSITDEREEEEIEIEEEDYEEAKILLSKNGNTVVKTLKELNDKKILTACLQIEQSNKRRKSILNVLIEKLEE